MIHFRDLAAEFSPEEIKEFVLGDSKIILSEECLSKILESHKLVIHTQDFLDIKDCFLYSGINDIYVGKISSVEDFMEPSFTASINTLSVNDLANMIMLVVPLFSSPRRGLKLSIVSDILYQFSDLPAIDHTLPLKYHFDTKIPYFKM